MTSHGPLDWPTREDDGHGTAAASRPKADRVRGRMDGFRRGGVADCASWGRRRTSELTITTDRWFLSVCYRKAMCRNTEPSCRL